MSPPTLPERSVEVSPWCAAPADEELLLRFHDPQLDDAGWIPVTVPSAWNAHPDLAGADTVLYRSRVAPVDLGDDERLWLEVGGVFSEADLWFDGHYLGDLEGYFVPHAVELDPHLLGHHDHVVALEVRHRPAGQIDGKHAIVGTWDDPRLVDPTQNPGGLWRPVAVARTGPLRLSRVRLRCREVSRSATATTALVALTAVIDADRRCTAHLSARIGSGEHRLDQPLTPGENKVEWLIAVSDAALWWPAAMGEPVLHDVEIRVAADDGEVSDTRRFQTGLRAVEMRDWVLHVNGEKVFAKGVNLGPTAADLASVQPADIERDLGLAIDAGFDLVRLRGHVAHPHVYDEADRRGLLVWQDLPLWRGYSKRIRKRAIRLATEAVDLLAHHPCLAIWCAHDTPTPDGPDDPTEPRPRFGGARAAVGQQLPTWNKTILDRSLKTTLEKADGTRPVIAHSGAWPHPPQLDGTDTHLWFGWRWGDERDLAKLAGRLPRAVRWVSELGAGSVPDHAGFVDTSRWPELDDAELASRHAYEPAVFAAHVAPSDSPDLDAWRQASQRYQAQVVRRHIETLRRLKYRPTGGFCVDHLVDARPAIGTSLVDHERTPKLAYAAATEACAEVIVVADRLPAVLRAGQAVALDVHVVNDRREPVEATVAAELRWPSADPSGSHELHHWAWSGRVDTDAVARVGTISWVAPDVVGPVTLILALSGDADATNRYDADLT